MVFCLDKKPHPQKQTTIKKIQKKVSIVSPHFNHLNFWPKFEFSIEAGLYQYKKLFWKPFLLEVVSFLEKNPQPQIKPLSRQCMCLFSPHFRYFNFARAFKIWELFQNRLILHVKWISYFLHFSVLLSIVFLVILCKCGLTFNFKQHSQQEVPRAKSDSMSNMLAVTLALILQTGFCKRN